MDERARFVCRQRFFEVVDGADLRVPKLAVEQRGKFAQALGQLFVLLHPGEQGFGPVEREDVATTRLGIEVIGEAGFRACAFVAERKRRAPGRQP